MKYTPNRTRPCTSRGKRCLCLLLGLVALLALTGCTQQQSQPVEKTNLMLDTIVTIRFYDDSDPALLETAFDEIQRLENLLSVTVEGSDLDRLNQAAGQSWVDIAPETEEVLRLAKEYSVLSGGYFDVTSGALIDLWNIHDGEGHYPTQEELDEAMPLTDSDALLVEEGRAYLTKEGMKVNLGAIAKGYIADRVKALLLDEGVTHAALDLGRNLLLIGGKTEEEPFRIGVQDPADAAGALVGYVSVADKSVVTSGTYERYFTYEGQRYHHILDPFTGFPADNGLASVTILSDSSAQGDALSTSCLLLGQEKGLALIESLDGVEALFIDETGTMTATDGFEAVFHRE